MAEALIATRESYIPPDFQKKALEVFPPSGKRILVLEALLNPENSGKTVKQICTGGGFSPDAYYNALRDGRFIDILVDIRESLYPMQRSNLADVIIRDAMTPLKEAFRVEMGEHGPEVIPYHSSLVKTREQAAAVVGLLLKQPDVSFSRSQHEVIHSFRNVPENILEEFSKTGVWKEEWGKRPWEKD